MSLALPGLNLVGFAACRSGREKTRHDAGLRRTFVGHFERRGRMTSPDNIKRLAGGLGIPSGELLRPQGARRVGSAQSNADP